VRHFVIVLLLGCIGCATTFSSRSTTVEPLPIKIGGLKDSSIELAVPLKTEKKKHGGYRSPLEIRFEILLTKPDSIPVQIMPSGVIIHLRIRW